jgi:hypothetical protein
MHFLAVPNADWWLLARLGFWVRNGSERLSCSTDRRVRCCFHGFSRRLCIVFSPADRMLEKVDIDNGLVV